MKITIYTTEDAGKEWHYRAVIEDYDSYLDGPYKDERTAIHAALVELADHLRLPTIEMPMGDLA